MLLFLFDQIWDLEMDILEGCVDRIEGHEGRITAVNLHPELPLLITGSLDGTVRLWDSTTYKYSFCLCGHIYKTSSTCFLVELVNS